MKTCLRALLLVLTLNSAISQAKTGSLSIPVDIDRCLTTFQEAGYLYSNLRLSR